MQQQVESDREGVKSFLEAGAGVALIPGLAPSRRGHHMPPLKKRQMWQLVLNLPARGQKHVAQQKCVLETELERTDSWAILGLGSYNFLLSRVTARLTSILVSPKLGRKGRS